MFFNVHSPHLRSGGLSFGLHLVFPLFERLSIQYGVQQKFNRGTVQENSNRMNVKNFLQQLKMKKQRSIDVNSKQLVQML